MKAYKVELLVIDFDEVGEEIKTIIEDQKYPNYCISPSVMNMQSVDIGEWDDSHPLNKKDKKKDFYQQIFNINLEMQNLQEKYSRLQNLHSEAMRRWEKESCSDVEMELAVLKTRLEPCTIDGADMRDNTVTVKFDNPDRVKGLRLMSNAKIIVERKTV